MNPGDLALLAGAGFVCGAVNTVAGGGSLILFAALLATGVPTLTATVSNAVACWPGFVGGVVGFRAELGAGTPRQVPLLIAILGGSVAGCAVLLATSSASLDLVVPWLVLLAAAFVGVQPLLRRLPRAVPASDGFPAWVLVSVFLAGAYGSYFGGALGVILLAILGVAAQAPMRQVTASKVVLALVNGTVNLVVFSLFGPVNWTAVSIAAPAALAGGYLGASIARRLGETVLRLGVVAFGSVVGVYLLVTL